MDMPCYFGIPCTDEGDDVGGGGGSCASCLIASNLFLPGESRHIGTDWSLDPECGGNRA